MFIVQVLKMSIWSLYLNYDSSFAFPNATIVDARWTRNKKTSPAIPTTTKITPITIIATEPLLTESKQVLGRAEELQRQASQFKMENRTIQNRQFQLLYRQICDIVALAR